MDTTELQGMMIDALQSLSDLGTTQQRFDEAITREVERIWQDNAALRDDLHALANRLEALTRAAPTVSLPYAENAQPCQKCGGTGRANVDGDDVTACAMCGGWGQVYSSVA